MKSFKKFLSITLAILFVFLITSSSQANDCSLCGKKIYVGSQCAGCTFNQFVNKLEHPCKICGQNIFFGKICRSCKNKIADSQKKINNTKPQSSVEAPENYNKNNDGDTGKKTSRSRKIWNSVTNSASNAYRTIFGTNKHD